MRQNPRLANLLDTLSFESPKTEPILVIRATNNPAYRSFDPAQLYCIQSFKPDVNELEQMGLMSQQGFPDKAGAAIVELTRSKPENLANIAKAYDALQPGAILFIDGAKVDGIDSILKAVKNISPIEGSYSKAHGKTIWLVKPGNGNPFNEWVHLAAGQINKDGFWTVPGIFSSDAIDPASALLCTHIAQRLKGKGADLGAGWGYLSHVTLQKNTQITGLDLYEAEQVSLECAKKNISDRRAAFHWQDVRAMPANSLYDFVIMNPPFHVSRKADPTIGCDFIAKAAKMLAPKGQLWMVANKQLAYEATLDASFNIWSYEEQSPLYKIIHAKRPK